MARHNHRRTELPPTTVRLSPGEREMLREKASSSGISTAGKWLSRSIRAALEAWKPERITLSTNEESATNDVAPIDTVFQRANTQGVPPAPHETSSRVNAASDHGDRNSSTTGQRKS